MQTTTAPFALMPTGNPAGRVLEFIRTQESGQLNRGDLIATDCLGPCEVLGVDSRGAITALRQSTGLPVRIADVSLRA